METKTDNRRGIRRMDKIYMIIGLVICICRIHNMDSRRIQAASGKPDPDGRGIPDHIGGRAAVSADAHMELHGVQLAAVDMHHRVHRAVLRGHRQDAGRERGGRPARSLSGQSMTIHSTETLKAHLPLTADALLFLRTGRYRLILKYC